MTSSKAMVLMRKTGLQISSDSTPTLIEFEEKETDEEIALQDMLRAEEENYKKEESAFLAEQKIIDITLENLLKDEDVKVLLALLEKQNARKSYLIEQVKEYETKTIPEEDLSKEEIDEAYDRTTRSFIEEDIKNVTTEILIKELFRKIASRTHPDRTKNKFLNGLFIRAKKAYQEKDKDELKLIFEMVKKGSRKRAEAVKEKLQQRKLKYQKLLQARKDFYNQVPYKLYKHYMVSRQQALYVYKQALQDTLNAVNKDITSLSIQVMKVKPKDGKEVTIEANGFIFKV